MRRLLALNHAGAVYRHGGGAMIPYRLRGTSTRATILRIVQLPLRAGLAAALSQAIAVFLGLPYPAFAMVAAILVTGLAPEQSRQLGLRRIGGTLIGAALGAVLGAILEPHPWTIALSIVAAMSVSNLLRAEEGARLAGFTKARSCFCHPRAELPGTSPFTGSWKPFSASWSRGGSVTYPGCSCREGGLVVVFQADRKSDAAATRGGVIR